MVRAALTTAQTGTHNDLVFTAVNAGPEGNSIQIEYLEPGGDNALSVTVEGQKIIVSLATTGGASTSTAADVMTAVQSHAVASKMVSVDNATSNDGTGIISTALSATNLTGGTFGPAQPSQTAGDVTNGMVVTPNNGLVLLEVKNDDLSSQTVTFKAPAFLVQAGQAADRAEAVAAGATRLFGPFPISMNQDQTSSGELWFNVSDADLKFRAYKVTQRS